jgi:putative transposase
MTRYRRSITPGGTFFFTVALANGQSHALTDGIEQFRTAYQRVHLQRRFETVATCVLPDHLHALWTLPLGDTDYARRWNLIKSGFSRGLPPDPERSDSKRGKREKGIWQRRFWEHTIRDEDDLQRHIDYIHHNPVKHGWAKRVSDWPYSSFHRHVERGWLSADWAGGASDAGGFGE